MFSNLKKATSFTVFVYILTLSFGCSYKGHTIEKTIFIDAKKEAVWSALTKRDELSLWWHKGVKLEPLIGGVFHEPWGDGQLASGKVLSLKPLKFIEFTWIEKSWDVKQNTVCNFSLTEKNGKTMLKVTHSGWRSFKDVDARNKLIIGFKRGWGALLPKIKKFVEEKK